MSRLAFDLRSSAARYPDVPTPADEYVTVCGFARASATRSATVLTGSDELTTRRFGATASNATGGTSRIGS